MVVLLLKIDDDNEEEENNYSDDTFSTAPFPAERAPDEDDDKGAGSGDNRSTNKFHVYKFSSVLLVKQCSNIACLN